MNAAGQVALWAALITAAWNAGFFGSRWSRSRGLVPLPSWSVFAAAAPLALAWASLTGAALRGDLGLATVATRAVVDAPAFHRVAAVLTSRPGWVLTLAFLLSLIMLTTTTVRPAGGMDRADRAVAVHSAVMMVVVALLVGAWPPFAPARTLAIGAVPAELLHPAAALRGLFAVGAVAAAVHGVALLMADRGRNGMADGRGASGAMAIGLTLATLSLASDQWARTVLASGDGRNAGGILLWVTLAILSHHRVRAFLHGQQAAQAIPRGARLSGLLTHIGAACIAAAFAAHVGAKRRILTLVPGQASEASDVFGRSWRFVNQGISRFDDRARDVTAIAIDVQGPRGRRLLTSERAGYHVGTAEGTTAPISTRGVDVGVLQTLLLTLESAGSDDMATVRVSFIPLTLLWLPGVALILIGNRGPTPVSPVSPVSEGEELVRRWRAAPVDCPSCGRRPEPDSRFCSNCGRVLLPCAQCGASPSEPMARFCADCGAELSWAAGRPNVSARSLPAGVGPGEAE